MLVIMAMILSEVKNFLQRQQRTEKECIMNPNATLIVLSVVMAALILTAR